MPEEEPQTDDAKAKPRPNLRLAYARREQGWTQQDVADKISESMKATGDKGYAGPTSDDVSRWERGIRRPLAYQRHLLLIYGKTASELGLLDELEPGFQTDLEAMAPEGPQEVVVAREPAARHQVRSLLLMAVSGALVACVWGGLAIFQVGPYAKAAVVVEGTVPRPAAAAHLRAKGSTRPANCPVTSSPFTKGPQVAILIQLATTTPACWTQRLSPVNPGTAVRYLITYFNSSSKLEDNVVVGTNLPPGVLLVPNTTKILNSGFPHGIVDPSNNIATGGVNIGNYDPAAVGYVEFEAALPLAGALDCYWNEFSTVGIAQVYGPAHAHRGNQFYNTATIEVYKSC